MLEIKRVIVVHYGEIGIKGKNRDLFEKRLIENIKCVTEKRVYRRYGKIIVDSDDKRLKKVLSKIPGIEYFSFGYSCNTDLEEIKNCVERIVKEKSFKTFKISAKRSFKKFPYTSLELNKILGEFVVENFGKKVDLKDPDVTIYVEISEKESFVYMEKTKGVGGLPVGEGKVVSLLSGGIDSPVASFLMMKRGLEVIFVHFYRSDKNPEKIKRIVEILGDYQPKSVLYLVPTELVQKKIVKLIPAKYRMLVYKRFMIKLANVIAEKEKAKALVLGDSIGQVASQTLDNINCVYASSSLPVFSPLIGFNKSEIVDLAKKIGTYEISIQPYEDCCSLLSSPHPETRCKKENIEKLEEKLGLEEVFKEILDRTEKFIYEKCQKSSSSRRGNASNF